MPPNSSDVTSDDDKSSAIVIEIKKTSADPFKNNNNNYIKCDESKISQNSLESQNENVAWLFDDALKLIGKF